MCNVDYEYLENPLPDVHKYTLFHVPCTSIILTFSKPLVGTILLAVTNDKKRSDFCFLTIENPWKKSIL